ncbi:LOW QUALITY PROTEIN: protein AIG2 A [Brassica napus]|uniref:LOW QUALITY PROTEIN: protein AIG2 A n=1 Tax=Brassica napus TaxID=3708 RepID=UPI00207875BF|nr:LOW QUALITY PROTEIN: protein AIG2 A [Brassica napus]
MTVDKEQEKDDLLPFYQINQENKEEEEEVVESRLRYEAINRALLTHLSHTHFFKQCTIRKKKKMSSSVSPSHNVFVYGSFQEPAVVGLILECTPVIVSAQLHGFHRYRLKGRKGRLHPCIAPFETGVINGKVLTGLTDAQLENLDMIEGDEYERKTVEVVLTDTLEKMEVEAFIWANKDDPDMYGEWDFEEWKRLHMEKFIEASKKFIEWKKNPNGKTREEFAKFVNEDPPVA